MIFHLGPAGALYELPVIERTERVEATQVQPVAIQRSLTGRVRKDVLGRARGRWVLTWVYLPPDQLALLSALAAGRLGGPLRLVDPDRPNLAHVALATGGTERRGTDGWLATGGTLGWAAITDPPAGVLANGAISWMRTTTAAGDLAPGRAGRAFRAPVRGTETMHLSAWVRATAGSPEASFGADQFDTTGTVSTVAGLPGTVAGTWTQWSYTWTPPVGRIEAAPVLRVADGQPTSTLQVTGVSISYGTTALGWHDGGGAPVVVAEAPPTEIRPNAGEFDVSLTLLEA